MVDVLGCDPSVRLGRESSSLSYRPNFVYGVRSSAVERQPVALVVVGSNPTGLPFVTINLFSRGSLLRSLRG